MVPGKKSRVVDLGCGCGVIGFGLILSNPEKEILVTGLDRCPGMISHSRKNAERLKLGHRFSALEMSVEQVNSSTFQAESYDLAVINPPYSSPGSGRPPRDTSRLNALFCSRAELREFIRAASFLVKNRGRVGMVFGTERLEELLTEMSNHSLSVKKILPVYGTKSRPARIVLMEAQKNAEAGLKISPPLILYHHSGVLTRQALKFCPFLKCNPNRKRNSIRQLPFSSHRQYPDRVLHGMPGNPCRYQRP